MFRFLVACALLLQAAAKGSWNSTLIENGLITWTSSQGEILEENLTLTGSIPEWLTGSYFRNGPGRFDVGPGNSGQRVNAIFDGYSVIHKVNFKTRTRISKFVSSPRYQSLLKRNDMNYQGKIMMGTTPRRKENKLNVFNLGGEVNVNFINVSGHILAVGELPYGMEIDPTDLKTVEGTDKNAFFKYDDDISELGVGCAHPVKLKNGDIISKTSTIPLTSVGLKSNYNIIKIAKGGTKREVVATLSKVEGGITYAHSFAVPSSRYAVLPFWPLRLAKTSVLLDSNLRDAMSWKPEDGTNVTVIDMELGTAITFRCSEVFFGFHFINSWVDEITGDIYADLVAFPDDRVFHSMTLERYRNGSGIDNTLLGGPIKRIRMSMSSQTTEGVDHITGANGTVSKVRLADEIAHVSLISKHLIEVPRINDEMLMNGKYNYVWGFYSTRSKNYPNAIAKINVNDGSALLWTDANDEFGVFVGEPVFVPRVWGKDDEDDGVVIAFCLHLKTSRAFVVVVDAKSMKELGRLVSPNAPITFGFHTSYFSE